MRACRRATCSTARRLLGRRARPERHRRHGPGRGAAGLDRPAGVPLRHVLLHTPNPTLDAADDRLRRHEGRDDRRLGDGQQRSRTTRARRDRARSRRRSAAVAASRLRDQQRPQHARRRRARRRLRERGAPRGHDRGARRCGSQQPATRPRSCSQRRSTRPVPGFQAIMSLGSGLSATRAAARPRLRRSASSRPSTSTPRRLTSCAGNFDDGLGDQRRARSPSAASATSTDNPADPNATTGDDDELYNLAPFLAQGVTASMSSRRRTRRRRQPFLAVISSPRGPTVTTEICDDGIDNDGDGLIDAADPDCAPPPTGNRAATSRATASRARTREHGSSSGFATRRAMTSPPATSRSTTRRRRWCSTPRPSPPS